LQRTYEEQKKRRKKLSKLNDEGWDLVNEAYRKAWAPHHRKELADKYRRWWRRVIETASALLVIVVATGAMAGEPRVRSFYVGEPGQLVVVHGYEPGSQLFGSSINK
jgi:hypothetical protein